MKIRNFLVLSIAVLAMLAALTASTALAQDAMSKEESVGVAVKPVLVLTPQNSSISFVGIHVGNDPKPRLGGFKQFRGYVEVDPESKSVQSLLIHIHVDSVWTEFSKLTTHFKECRLFRKQINFQLQTFESTKITKKDGSNLDVEGNLTLHGKTKPVRFSLAGGMDSSGLIMKGQFKLDRETFGMNKMLSGVDKMVSVELSIGQKTKGADKVSDGHGGDSKKKTKVQRRRNKYGSAFQT